MAAVGPPEAVHVLVEYGFEYRAKDGTLVSIKPNERYVLLRRTNDHWWHVRRSGDARPFYIPAQYVKELPAMAAPAPLLQPPAAAAEGLPTYEYRFVRAAETAVPARAAALSSFGAPPRSGSPHRDGPAQLPGGRAAHEGCSKATCAADEDAEAAGQLLGPGREAQTRKEPEQPPAPPPEPVYLNVAELREEAAAAAGRAAPGPAPAWEAHVDSGSGRVFYYNPLTGASRWECPEEEAEDGVSPGASPASSPTHRAEAAAAWGRYVDEASGQAFFYNSVTGETSWDPPDPGAAGSCPDMSAGVAQCGAAEQRPPTPETDYPELSPDELDAYADEERWPAGSYEHSAPPYALPRRAAEPASWCRAEAATVCAEHDAAHAVPVRSRQDRASSGSSQDGGGAGTWHGPLSPGPREEQCKSLEKAGVLNRTKTADRGKRLRKNWSSSWTVLEGGILTFFKDSKHSSSSALRHSATLTTPEHTVELRGATVAWAGRDKSSKRNVLELRTRDGSEFLMQHDSEQIIVTWQRAIVDSIARLSADFPPEDDVENEAEFGSREKLFEEKRTSASGQATGSGDGESDSSKVRSKLRKFLQRRPTLQSLRERGYIKDQVFGCSLQALCERERSTVPRFVLQCIQTVERRGLDIDGLYRVSGNLATIQKLRYKVDHDEHLDLDDGRWEDVHVVTGALKLFFRELPEPLFPFTHFDKFIAAIKMQEPTWRSRCVRDLVYSLPPANHDTMRVLFQHLCRVIEYKEENRMSVQSVAIVFGPTLLRPASEEGNMAMHMVFQNQIVEHILNQYSYIFPDG